ncbi:MAG: DUF5989 family protein [Planctomycetota bacterium]|nr:DUF5989 family protein [Planctomycetota bacterium]
MTEKENSVDSKSEFELQAVENDIGVVREFILFLKHNKKWWLTPIIIALLLIAVIVISAGTGAAPFIYTLF